MHCIYYASIIINNTLANYVVTKKEIFAMAFAFNKFRSYRIVSKIIICTDHAALRYLIEKKSQSRA